MACPTTRRGVDGAHYVGASEGAPQDASGGDASRVSRMRQLASCQLWGQGYLPTWCSLTTRLWSEERDKKSNKLESSKEGSSSSNSGSNSYGSVRGGRQTGRDSSCIAPSRSNASLLLQVNRTGRARTQICLPAEKESECQKQAASSRSEQQK